MMVSNYQRKWATLTLTCAMLMLLLLSVAEASFGSGDVVSSRPLAGSSFGSVRDLPGVPVTQLESGGYLAFRETARTKKVNGDTYVLDSRVVSVRKYSSGGKVDRPFDRSQIGRGLTLGRKGEIVDVRRIIRLRGDVYLGWATSDGYTGGQSERWPRSWVIAFSGLTGKLIPTFGKRGIIQYGASWRKYSTAGFSTTEDVTVDSTGRIVACGSLSKWVTPGSGPARLPGFTPFVVQGSALARTFSSFFATGRTTTEVVPNKPKHYFKSCYRTATTAAGGVYAAGLDSANANLISSEAWINKFQPDGTRDLSFGNGGEVLLESALRVAPGNQLSVRRVFLGPDEKLYVVGAVRGGAALGYVARLMPNGAPDNGFGQGGITLVDGFIPYDAWRAEDEKLVVTGRSAKYRPAIGRLDSSGAWDAAFNTIGWKIYPNAFSSGVFRVTGSRGIRVWSWWSPRTGKRSTSQVVDVAE